MNYNEYQLVKTLDGFASKEGFEVHRSNHGSDHVSLMTSRTDTKLPVYARGISIFNGTVEDCVCFLQGWYKQREYLTVLLRLKTDRIEDAEQKLVDKYNADMLVTALKTGKDIGWMTPKEDDPNHASL